MGKTLGVIGRGAIGVKVCNAAVGLGMKVIGYDPFLTDKAAETLDKSITITSKKDDIFTLSDYITVHAPLTAVYTAPLKPATIRSIWSRRVVYRSVSTLPA